MVFGAEQGQVGLHKQHKQPRQAHPTAMEPGCLFRLVCLSILTHSSVFPPFPPSFISLFSTFLSSLKCVCLSAALMTKCIHFHRSSCLFWSFPSANFLSPSSVHPPSLITAHFPLFTLFFLPVMIAQLFD